MVEKQVKMDFAKRELKYRDNSGEKVILPFTCHGITSLQQEGYGSDEVGENGQARNKHA
ncbi:hypothetical protein PF005_g22551 [Phytophthora fragariae]|uniref:Uncharacterized protein n=1 Tax=Phytophthora fragariae TaxID=53985 RepID=A0A6A3QY93_9STRA|nr:hypothetical protein PF007_g21768 [Phytophthora fragariae]KAE9182284.1 hypothetical protein PF005_g22551 [Phytophthora fragariae]